MAQFTNFTRFTHIATAVVGALVLSTACVAAAVGPAHSVERSAAVSYAAAPLPASAQGNA